MGKRGKRRRGYWSEEEQRFIRIKKRRRCSRGKRMSEAKRNFKERAGWKNRHHIQNKCRGGSWHVNNILMMDERRHVAFHLLFGNMNFLQVIDLLRRAYEMKNRLPHAPNEAKPIIPLGLDNLEFDGIGLS